MVPSYDQTKFTSMERLIHYLKIHQKSWTIFKFLSHFSRSRGPPVFKLSHKLVLTVSTCENLVGYARIHVNSLIIFSVFNSGPLQQIRMGCSGIFACFSRFWKRKINVLINTVFRFQNLEKQANIPDHPTRICYRRTELNADRFLRF